MPTICEATPGKGTVRLSRTGKGSVSDTLSDELHPTSLQSLIEQAYSAAREAAKGN